MQLISVSVDTFLFTSLCILPITYYVVQRYQAKSQAPYRDALTILVLLHTLYIVYVMTMLYPSNIFTRLRIPISTPSERIRSALLARAGLDSHAVLPKPLDTLLTRLSSFDVRLIFIRFGQAVVQDCEYCRTWDQYSLYALPEPLLQYIREAAVIGLLTVENGHRSKWRTPGIVAVVISFAVEAYIIASAQITIPRNGKDVFMYHDTLWLLRQVVFLFLPILVHCLPIKAPPDPGTTITQATAAMKALHGRTSLSRHLRGAVMRDPSWREAAYQWWDRQKAEGQCAREDENVQRAAERIGSGFVEGHGKALLLPKMVQTTAALVAAAFAPPQAVSQR